MEDLRRQLREVDTSLMFLTLLVLSVCLSWRGVVIQREGLCRLIAGTAEEVPDPRRLRLTAGAVVVGALTYFFSLALKTWEGSPTPSARLNLWASLFVLAAAVLRLYDLVALQPGAGEEPLPD